MGKTALVVELDAGLRGMDIMLGVENSVVYDLGDVLHGSCVFGDAIVAVERFPGLSMIAASASVSDLKQMERVESFCQQVRPYYDYVIVDMPAGATLSTAVIPKCCDLALIVATPDPVSVRDSNNMVSLLAAECFRSCKLIINKVNIRHRKQNLISDLDEVMDGVGIPLLGVIPDDVQIKSAFSGGAELEKNSPPEIVFRRIAARIEGEYTPLYIV